MPGYPPPDSQWFALLLARLKAETAAQASQSTQYVCDPAGKCWVIIGNLTYDNKGTATGIGSAASPKWGIASIMTGTWSQVA